MEFNNIEYFLAIAKHRNITRAAHELYISQPALSKYLAKLETQLGTTLFERSGKNLSITASGMCYMEYAINISESKNEFLNELQTIKQSHTDSLSIGFATNGLRRLLPNVIKNFQQRMPNVELNISEYRSWIIEEKITSGEIDIGFVSLPTPHPNMETETILEEYVLLAVPASNKICNFATKIFGCKYPWIDIKHFNNSSFVLQNDDTRFRRLTDRIFNLYKINPQNVITTHNKLTAKEIAEQLELIYFTTDYFITSPTDDNLVRYFAIGDPIEKAATCIAYKKHSDLTKQAREFLMILKELI